MGKKRQSVTFTEDAAALLDKLANDRKVSVSEVLRTALNHEAWLSSAIENGTIYYKPDDEDTQHEVRFVG